MNNLIKIFLFFNSLFLLVEYGETCCCTIPGLLFRSCGCNIFSCNCNYANDGYCWQPDTSGTCFKTDEICSHFRPKRDTSISQGPSIIYSTLDINKNGFITIDELIESKMYLARKFQSKSYFKIIYKN